MGDAGHKARRGRSGWIAGCLLPLALLPAAGRPHAFVDHASPAIGAAVAAPASVRIWFTEKLEAAYSGMEVVDQTGSRVDRGDASVDAKDQTLLRASLKPLSPGVYRVVWRAVTRDAHIMTGDFLFTVMASA